MNHENMWPIVPHRITLRVCHDLDWRVSVSCPVCRYGVDLNTRALASGRYADTPVYRLLEQGAFKCRQRKSSTRPDCAGAPATMLSITAMNVGMSETVAQWSILSPPPATARLVKCGLQAHPAD
jgi:hypothetical protein